MAGRAVRSIFCPQLYGAREWNGEGDVCADRFDTEPAARRNGQAIVIAGCAAKSRAHHSWALSNLLEELLIGRKVSRVSITRLARLFGVFAAVAEARSPSRPMA